ncbi:Wadjet anti-phage system protein JetD domain-containing protein [Paracidovorax avenae]|uniref:Wadjet anti-phage system protein JetD domain-containing protein n=1 Tax=Paracidovorax avenae TaxID=80867 RepID=UPI0009EBCFDC|nr:Wadjet anti-phage system protein JetD domain-containing protein [Paracidovorax avenae]
MKSPRQLAAHLARQWHRPEWRERHLLPNPGAWPIQLPIGLPPASAFLDAGPALRDHLQQWRDLTRAGPGTVQWEPRNWRGSTAAVQVPTHWVLARPSEYLAAIARWAAPAHDEIAAEYRALAQILGEADARFHRLLLRRPALWRHMPADEVLVATRVALQLEPGCAAGRPLRALAVAGNDSKFFERNASLLKALLDERFDGEPGRQGLAAFLDAAPEGEHWVLIAPLAPGLLPLRRLRATTADLHSTPLPARRILLVENERSLHQLPVPLADTIAVLGCGLDLAWLAAPWLQERHAGYWGDLDTWGFAMLARARAHLPRLQAVLMDWHTFDAHAPLAVTEPVHAPAASPGMLHPDEEALERHLRTLCAGRIEQEFLSAEAVAHALDHWHISE